MEIMITEERHSHYDYELWAYTDNDYPDKKHYYYKILDKGGEQHYWTGCPVIREAQEAFDTAQEARFAAIGHIESLENGEG